MTLLGKRKPHQLSSNSQYIIKEIRATPLVSFKSFLIKKKTNHQCTIEAL